jgi:hypothetical protein
MKWQPEQKHFIESVCGDYRISKMLFAGEIRYLSWQKTDGKWEVVGEYSKSFKQAVSRYHE